ncbi:hypothetical protein FSY45_25200 [Comamonas sp. Z1]|nr:hypothetical protein FSY45_25200 [Comamonas sp. Z1]
MCDCWKAGDTLHEIDKLFDRPHSFIHTMLANVRSRQAIAAVVARPIAVIQRLIGPLYGRASTAIKSLNICSCPSSFLQIQIL